jgi:hypothetical protein
MVDEPTHRYLARSPLIFLRRRSIGEILSVVPRELGRRTSDCNVACREVGLAKREFDQQLPRLDFNHLGLDRPADSREADASRDGFVCDMV